MGGYLSKWRKQPSTIEILEKLDKDIKSLERCRQTNVDKQKRIITSLLLYSIAIYVFSTVIFYFIYLPNEWLHRFLYSSPLLVFPFMVWLIKRFLHWYFVKRIHQNENALEELKEKKKTILNEVMERETYKKAKEILEKFGSTEQKNETVTSAEVTSPKMTTGGELRQRTGGQTGKGLPGHSSFPSSSNENPPSTPLSGIADTPSNVLRSSYNKDATRIKQMMSPGAPPTPPPMARPVLPKDRNLMDRMVEYLLGDGPQNRFALICTECQSHNGMALKEEFEYLSFRCCYCYAVNSARRLKPKAPPLDPVLTSRQASALVDPVATNQRTVKRLPNEQTLSTSTDVIDKIHLTLNRELTEEGAAAADADAVAQDVTFIKGNVEHINT